MRRFTVTPALCLVLLCGIVLSQETPATGALEGTVVRNDSGEPVAGVFATLSAVKLAPPGMPLIGLPAGQNPVSEKTDSDGRFSFKNLSPGPYRVSVQATGFLKQEYAQNTPYGQGRLLFVAAGQTVKDATIRLTPTASISGLVLDEKGQFATGASVQLLRILYSASGRNFRIVAGSVADDRGRYRLFDVAPGRYLLLAGTQQGPPRSSPARYSLVFYRDTENIDQASMLDVKSGSDVSIDMRVRKQNEVYRVKGRVVGPTSTAALDRVNIALLYRAYGTSGGFGLGRNVIFDPKTGVFEMLNIPPGAWLASAQLVERDQTPFGGPVDPDTMRARLEESVGFPLAATAFRVVNSDIEDLVLTLHRGGTTTGRMLLEGRPVSSIPDVNRIRLDFIRAPDSIDAPVALPAAADGTFEVRGIHEGEYRLIVGSIAPGLYVKNVRYGGDDLLMEPFQFPASDYKTFEVTLGTTAAQISGKVTDANSRAVTGIQVFLVPSQRRRSDLHRIAVTDQDGRFSMALVPPGDYKLFSWEAAEDGATYDPDFLKQHEEWGKAVHVEETSNLNVEVQLIAAP